MRDLLLSSVAAAALVAAVPAVAQQATTPVQGTQLEGATAGSVTQNQQAQQNQGQSFRSFSRAGNFQGQVAGDQSADELMGRMVVDDQGDTIGTVEDLAIGQDDRVEHVVVEFSNFPGTGGPAGATGNVTQPQLHFEIRKGQRPIDPMPLLSN